jgi:hypothetical protein
VRGAEGAGQVNPATHATLGAAMDVKPGKRKGIPLDSGRAERGVWLIKVPQFLATQWQAVPLLQERETARTRTEPVLVAALVPVLRRVACVRARGRGHGLLRAHTCSCRGSR